MTRKKTPAAEDVPEALEPMAEEQTEVAETLSGEGTDVHPEETGTMELAAETSESPEVTDSQAESATPQSEATPEKKSTRRRASARSGLTESETSAENETESEMPASEAEPGAAAASNFESAGIQEGAGLPDVSEGAGGSSGNSPIFLGADLDHPNAEGAEPEIPDIPDIPYGEDEADMDAATDPIAHQEPANSSVKSPDPPIDERRAFFGLDFHELDRGLTPEQQQEWNSIYASYRGHNVMTGSIAGVDRLRMRVRDRKTGEMKWQQMFCAIVIPFRVRILIPETELWMPGEERPNYVLRNIPGAVIDFVITGVDREGGYAIGSRKAALPSRRYYFSTQPGMHHTGSRITCNVLVVGPRRCLVSCNGFDISLTQRELSWSAIPDLRDKYHSGDYLSCIVRHYDQERGRLSISVKETLPNPFDGAVFRHPQGSHRQAMIAGKYGGGIFCNLPDGVTIMCNYSFHYDDSAFRVGDRVILIVQRYDMEKKQIYGKIVAKV